MKKIIHMSDLHIGYKDFQDKFISIIDNLKSKISDELSQYIVVITGDLVNDANEKTSYKGAQQCLDYLKQIGFEFVLVIPGNHDYGTGTMGKKKFVKLFQSSFYRKEIDYPKVDIIDEIAFIGLDSMAQELNWYDTMWSQGEIGKSQLSKLVEIFNQDKICACKKRVIYLHHHPFRWRPLHQLKDARKLKKILMQIIDNGVSIDAVLFGHNHQGNDHNGRWGIPRCYDGGTVTLKPRPKYLSLLPWFKVKASTRLINLNKDPSKDYTL